MENSLCPPQLEELTTRTGFMNAWSSSEFPCQSVFVNPALLEHPHSILSLQEGRTVMCDTYLLRTESGRGLPAEVVLRIVEFVIGEDPRSAGGLMRLSKTFNWLIKAYERSITLSNTTSNPNKLSYTNSSRYHILGCRAPPNNSIITKTLSYAWYTEMHTRNHIIEYLSSHEITSMSDSTSGWPRLSNIVPRSEHPIREKRFKQLGFLLLFRLADCTAGLQDTSAIRMKQGKFLEGLSVEEAAILCCLVEVVGQGFLNITARVVLPQFLETMRVTANTYEGTTLGIPSRTENDVPSENWLRECMCVFEDRMQRYGPYFAYVYLCGSANKARRPDLWAKEELQTGLDEMNEYELGNIMAYASLQSVVWKVFCRKRGCSVMARWIEVKAVVEGVMAGFKL